MKLSVFLFLFSVLQASALSLYSQQERVSIKANNVDMVEFLELLEEQTELSFMYKDIDVLKHKDLSVDYNNAELKQILNEVLKDKQLSYVIVDDVVIIKPVEFQQQVETLIIKGKITDDKGKPIPGVNIIAQEIGAGSITDIDGKYIIKGKFTVGVKIVFSFIGMKTEELVFDGETNLDLVMLEDQEDIDEVVVTGIFNRKASTFTGSVSSYKGEKLKSVSNSNVFESIKNLDPSLMIIDNMDLGSDPNMMPEMQLRGTSSFDLQSDEQLDIKGTYGTSANAPLFILDGFQASIEKILDLDMDRVESMTILKDASAKSIYGSKAANGVIVIETKVNPDGKALVRYNGSVSIVVPDLSSYNLMNAEEKLQFEVDYGLYGGSLYSEDRGTREEAFYQSKLRMVQEGVDTDWLSKPVQNGIGTKQRLAFEIGDDVLRMIAGFTYNNVQGAMKGSSRKSYSGDINISYRYKKLSLRNQLNIVSNVSNNSPYGSFSDYAKMNPYYSPYDREGNLVKHPPLKIDITPGHEERYYVDNPLWNSKVNSILQKQYLDVTNNLYAKMYWNDYLRSSVRLGIGLKRVEGDTFYPANHTKFRRYTNEDLIWRRGSYQVNEGRSKDLSGDINTTYSKNFGNHFVMFNIGGQLSELIYDEVIFKAEGLPSDDMNSIMFAKQYAENSKPKGKEETRREIGGLGVVNYAYKNRYLFDASIRYTGSSQYGSNTRWGHFWSTGLGWNMHEEEWMDSPYIQRLKLRGSVGTTGSQIPSAYAGAATYQYILDKTYKNIYGLNLIGMRNDDLKWQHKLDKNIGMEFSAFKKLSVTLDFYESTTENALISSTLAPSTGFRNVDENMGKVINKGIDLKTTYTVWSKPKERSFISLMITASRNKNEIKELSDAMKAYNDRIDALFNDEDENQTRPLKKYVEGASMNAIWAVPSLGIDPATGREIFVKKDGTRTYNYSGSQQQVLGNSLPDVHGNIGASIQYKGFGLNMSLYYKYGGQMYNYTLSEKVEGYDIRYNVDKRVLDGAWSQVGDVKPYAPNDRMASVTWEDGVYNYNLRGSAPTGRFVFDQNELSLSSVNISYDFWKHKWIKKLGLSNLKLSAYGNNLYTWSTVEVERGTSYPFARTFNFAVSATF